MVITILKLSWGPNDFHAFLRYIFDTVIRDYALNFQAKWLSMLRSHSYVNYSIGIFYFIIYCVKFHAGYNRTKIILGPEWLLCVFTLFLWQCNTRLRTELSCKVAVYVEVYKSFGPQDNFSIVITSIKFFAIYVKTKKSYRIGNQWMRPQHRQPFAWNSYYTVKEIAQNRIEFIRSPG
jgi:hypothetical protein